MTAKRSTNVTKQPPEPSGTAARPKKAKKAKAPATPNAFHGVTTSHAVAPAAHADDEPKPANRVGATQAEQSAKFERVAREHEAEGDEETLDANLRKIAKTKPA